PRHRAGLCDPGGAPRRPPRPRALDELPQAPARTGGIGAEARRTRQVRGAQEMAPLRTRSAEGCLVTVASAARMHDHEREVDAQLVRRLLAAQFPQWADLPLERVLPAGTDNAIFRLGGDMSVRLPRIESATGQPEKEHEWLPRLAPGLPPPVPRPLAGGGAGGRHPHPWARRTWLRGRQGT